MPKVRPQSSQKSVEDLQEDKAMAINNILRMKRSIQEKTISLNPYEIECRLKILDKYIEQAMMLQNEIDHIKPNPAERAELENICVSTEALFLSFKDKRVKRGASLNEMSNTLGKSSRLPILKLPKFSGKHSEFKNFIGLFENLVDSDNTLSDIEKFNHLISCLADEALGTVKAFHINDANYGKALESLKRVYDNKCLIFFDTISNLFALPKMQTSSASALRSLVDSVSAVHESLLSIADSKQILDGLLIHLIMSKVDSTTRIKWEEQINYSQLPTWNECQAALDRRFQHISAAEVSTSGNVKPPAHAFQRGNSNKSVKRSFNVASPTTKQGDRCVFCKSVEHAIFNCNSFKAISVGNRFEFVKTAALCINCLKTGHSVHQCKSSKCRVCSKPHHTLLHRYISDDNAVNSNLISQPSEVAQLPMPDMMQVPQQSITTQCEQRHLSVNHSIVPEDQIILATAVVKIQNNLGESILARALLDSGSQVNCITDRLAKVLRIQKDRKNIKLIGIGNSNSSVHHQITAVVQSRISQFRLTSEFLVLKKISNLHPERAVPLQDFKRAGNIELADPWFYNPQSVDLLLGAESFFEILCAGQIKLGQNRPTLQNTQLGWIVSGKYEIATGDSSKACKLITSYPEETEDINCFIKKFWELEEIPSIQSATKYTDEQLSCEQHFIENICRSASGRLRMSLPFKSDPSSLGSSYEVAKRRFITLERKLAKDPETQSLYTEFMTDYLDLGHMSLVTDQQILHPHYYIPHHCVLRPNSLSTKLRVVFDASTKSSSGLSLNDILMVGPTIQPDLFSILLRFRLHRYVMTADISKMYRQFELSESDRKFQLILWRKNPNDAIHTYQLNTVTYGTSPAPFLATRCLLYLSEAFSSSHPTGSKALRDDFYVDDLLTGAESFNDLEQIRTQVVHILGSAKIQLAKWYSNHPEYVTQRLNPVVNSINKENTKTLGIQWNPQTDHFEFQIDQGFHSLPSTKRNMLSISSRLFDPLGLLGPVIIVAKILLQELWLQNIDWDISIPESLNARWQRFKNQLLCIHKIKIPRFVETHSKAVAEIHGFCDASIHAYGCCLYVRTTDDGNVKVRLLTGKSKVAPLKTKSLPRLELCAAQLLAKLWHNVKELFYLRIEKVTFWTDSEIVIHWIKTHPSTLSTFVGNRVSDIQELSEGISWRHVPSKDNPADIISRGCTAEELKSSIWFEGPKFLAQESSCWPTNSSKKLPVEHKKLEMRTIKVTMLTSENDVNSLISVISKYSSYNKLLHIFAYILRFASLKLIKTDPQREKLIGPLIAAELNSAFFTICEILQGQAFKDELQKYKNSALLSPNLQKLNPFIHEFNVNGRKFSLLRVGGRLMNAPLTYDSKFPILMPKNCHFVQIYLKHLHLSNFHAGPKILIALLRQKIWLINAREVCQRLVRNCIHCFRYKPKLLSQIMGNLPSDRLRAVRPFFITGVDFCGPFYTTLRLRGRPAVKMYIAVFVCFSSKAVHLELVTDLSTNCFLLCLKRFIARRGVPMKVFCDNATNFVGAAHYLEELKSQIEGGKQALETYALDQGFKFCFIPPRAPHFGGLWEAAVKSAKTLLLKVAGNALLTGEELNTLVVQVEAILNSRPLTPMSQDPNDGEALTPAHLLVGGTLSSLPYECPQDSNTKNSAFTRVADIIRCQNALLASVVAGLHPRVTATRKVDGQASQSTGWRYGRYPGGQYANNELAGRQNSTNNTRGGRRCQSRRRKN